MSSPKTFGVAVSPTALKPSTPASKRRITPSAELSSSSKRILLLTTPSKKPSNISPGAQLSPQPFFAPKQLFPHGVASVSHHTSAHSSPEDQQQEKATWNNRHVLIPFNLQDKSVDIFKGEVCDLLFNVFPGTTSVGETGYRSQLVFEVKELPRKPWPLTVGGLPFTISDKSNRGRALIFPRQNLGNMKISICEEGYDVDKVSDKVLRELAADVNAQFQKSLPDVRIIEIMFTCERTVYIFIDDHIKISSIWPHLPGKIANCPVGYLHESQLHRPLWEDLPAKRQINPQPFKGIVDNTVYDIMRPGVMICSKMMKDHSHPAVFSTTSGVLVKNPAGDRFMTGASHGIGELGTVWQAERSDKIIGKAVVEISFTDISLVELSKDVKFVNQTFEDCGGVVPKFTRLVTSDDEFKSSLCNLNSPFTGNMDSHIVIKSVKPENVSKHPTLEEIRYVVYNWTYMGQQEGNEDKVQPPDGTCGSVIWDDEGIILGFYQYYIAEGPWQGFSASVSASEVIEAGYTLAE